MAILGFLYGMGEIFFGSLWFGMLLMTIGVLILYFIVKRLVGVKGGVGETIGQ